MKTTIITKTVEETQALGERLAKKIQENLSDHATVLCLYGDLGSGKTTFVQGVAKGLGIDKRIISPTFVIVRSYTIPNEESEITNFYHLDLYRIQTMHDIEGLGISEMLEDPKNVVVIEWPEKLETILPHDRIDIHFAYTDENRRDITILAPNLS